MDPITIILALVGIGVGFGASTVTTKRKIGSAEAQAEKELEKAKKEAEKVIQASRDEAHEIAEAARKDEKTRRNEFKDIESRLLAREESLDKKLDLIDKRTEQLRKSEDEVESLKNEIREIRGRQQEKLEKIAKLTKADAAEKLMAMTERDIKEDMMGLIVKLQNDAKDLAEEKAAVIITEAMERMASEVTAERTVTAVKLEDEEMKGRIIGKEGRNIQALQRATGVDIMVDDTPGMIILSSFDPVRREVARVALEMLLKDGRVHPGRIEEVVDKAQKQVQKDVMHTAEDAAREVGIVGIPKEILQYLGELKFRTSYGQNVLKHSTEMTHMAGVIAEQIGADTTMTLKQRHSKRLLSEWLMRSVPLVREPATSAPKTLLNVCATLKTSLLVLKVLKKLMQSAPAAKSESSLSQLI
jgi:ribonuclease Y